MARFYSATFVLFVLFSLQLSAQTGKYDLKFALSYVDCDSSKLYINIQIKAHESQCAFHLSDQNYRIQFNNTLVYNSVFIAQEMEVSGHIESLTGYSFYKPHTLDGSLDSIVSYNIEFIGGEGLLLEANEWTNVGKLGFDIADIDGTISFIYMDESMYPSTFIGEFYNQTRMTATTGDFEGLEINLQDYCGLEEPESGSEEDTTVGVINSEIENSINLFPTLASDFIHLRCGDNICGDLRIIDINGRIIQHWQEAQNKTSYSFDVSTLPNSIYFLQININGYYLTRRFIKV